MTAVTITATYGGVAKTAALTVNPPAALALAGVTMNPATMIFGSTATGTVTLTAAAPAGGAVVALSSSEWVSFVLPASVTVPAGATSAQFPVTTAIGKATTIITASYNGVNKTATLTSVYPTVAALTCTPNPVIAGNTTICTVTLNGIMPAATPVWILSDQPFFAPASGTVTVPAGAVSTAFSDHDDPCPRSDRCAHLGQRSGDRHGDSAADDQSDEPRQEVGPEQRRLQGRQHGERLLHL